MIFVSIFGILTLVMLARALGFAKNPDLSETTARDVSEAALPGFQAAAVAVDPSSRSAVVTASDGRVAQVRPHGDRWVVRLTP